MFNNDLLHLKNKTAFYCVVFILYFFFGITSVFYKVSIAFAFINAAVGICLFVSQKNLKFLKAVSAVLIISAFGLLWASAAKFVYHFPAERILDRYEGVENEFILRIDKTDSYGDSYANYDCSILAVNGKAVDNIFGVYPSVRLNLFSGDFAGKGDIVSLRTVVSKSAEVTADGFREYAYLKSRHIFMLCESNGSLKLLRKGNIGRIDSFREVLSNNITRYTGHGDESLIAKCMLLGDKTGIPKYMKRLFQSAGLSHILSVSGFHLSILFMTVSMILGLAKRSPRRRFPGAEVISCIFILLYMMLANFTPSVMRAGFMHIFINLYSVFLLYKRRFFKAESSDDGYYKLKYSKSSIYLYDSVSALFCAGTLIILLSPYSVYDVGMQLSFMSTLGILVSGYAFADISQKIKNKGFMAVLISVIVTASAVSFTLPLCIYNFGTLSTVSIISNLIISPIVMPLLVVLLFLALVSLLPSVGVVTSVCMLLGELSKVLCGVCIWCAKVTGSLLFSVVRTEDSVVLNSIFTVYVIVTLLSLLFDIRKICTVGFCSLVVLNFVYTGISFLPTVLDIADTKVNFCTVKRHPYLCVMSWDDRIYFDDASGIASDSTIEKSFGNQLYDTDNFYVVVPRKDGDFKSVLFNIRCIDKTMKITTVLLPSSELCKASGVDMERYSDFVNNLNEMGFDYRFYGDRFRICNVDFDTEVFEESMSFSFDGFTVIYSEEYDGEFAGRISEDKRHCIYFCDRADETDNKDYDSSANLYVSSPLYKNIARAQSIPTREPGEIR